MEILNLGARLLNPILMIAMPLGLGIYLTRRFRTDWGLFGVGAVTFLAAQVLHIPFNILVLGPALERLGVDSSTHGLALFLVFLVLGLSAGIFEETARYLSYRYWIKDTRTWEGGLTFGAGHGGIESILLGILVLFAFFQALALGRADLLALIPTEQLTLVQEQLETYWTIPWHLAMLGAVERAGTLVVHLCLAIIVLQAFLRRNILWLAVAVSWHALLNAGTLMVLELWGPYWAEAFVILGALVSLGVIFALRPENTPTPTATPVPAALPDASSIEPSTEQLEDSRYV